MLLQILFKVLKIQTTIKGIKDDKGENWYVMKGWEIKKGKNTTVLTNEQNLMQANRVMH